MTNAKQAAFLQAYSQTANITSAAKAAEIGRKSHYRWMDDDSEYAEAFALAHEEACEALEAEARRRAVDGTLEPVIYQGAVCYEKKLDADTGKWTDDFERPLVVRKYSDTMLIFLMKAAKPEKYRENFKGEVKDLFKSQVDMSVLSAEELAQAEALARKVSLRAA